MNIANSDIVLWESFRKGDRTAFEALFRQHYEILFRYGSQFTDDTELIEDTIQELFIELWQAKARTPVISVKGYLLKSLKYKLLKAFRQRGRIQQLPNDTDLFFEWSHDIFLITQQENAEKKQRVLKALGSLPNRQKEIVYLKYYQNLSYDEVSEIMNINYQAARNLLYQAIRSLKNKLAGPLPVIFLLSAISGHYILHAFSTC